MRVVLSALLGALLILLADAFCQAKPDLGRKLGPTIADSGSAVYLFTSLDFTSNDGERRYRVSVAIPRRTAPEKGYPVIYMLDGNAVLAALDEPRLRALAADEPPVIVMLGYETDLPFEVRARAFDYTPALADGRPMEDALAPDRKNGGADDFLALIERRIKPAVGELARLDPLRQTLWGHSYGGLFVLHVLLSQPHAFQTYAAADPTLWWRQGALIERARAMLDESSELKGIRLLVMRSGEGRNGPPPPNVDPAVLAARQKAMASVPEDAALQLTRSLSHAPGIAIQYREYPQLTHGPLLPMSIGPALRLAMGHWVD